MARKYKIITPEDRRTIERAYLDGAAPDKIAAEVGASTASIYREIARGYTGGTDKNGRPAYSAQVAQTATEEALSRRGRPFAR
jgi:IS30 family transposase